MSTLLEHLDEKSLAPYLPIKNAGRNVSLMILFVIMLATVIAAMFLPIDIERFPWLTKEMTLAGYGVALLCLFVTACCLVCRMIGQLPECNGSILEWWRQYRTRNVCGYGLRCALGRDGKVVYTIEEPGEPPSYIFVDGLARIMILVNLATERCEIQRKNIRAHGWTVCLRRVEIGSDSSHLVFRLSDKAGCRVDMTDKNTLDIFARQFDHLLISEDFLEVMVEEIIEKLNWNERGLKKTLRQRDAAIRDIGEAVIRIGKTQRFVQSVQGAEIRAWLVERSAAHMLGYDPADEAKVPPLSNERIS